MKVIIRRAKENEIEAVIRLAAELCHQHRAYDKARFYIFDNLKERLSALFAEETVNPSVAVLVAEKEEQIIGYAFLRVEAASLIEISNARVWLHDIYVDEAGWGGGIGKQLLEASIEFARSIGSPVLMLHVAKQNEFAAALFTRHNFRATMQEMLLETT